jgi:fido (protein-threonine AMPylation protein)
MSRHSDNDPYLDPTAGVLRNRLGIADEASLEQAEAAFVATRFRKRRLRAVSISRT